MSSPFAYLFESAALARGTDDAHMRRALLEARKGVGRTAPNPPVGAVLVRREAIIGAGFHARAGERHGEVVALDDALAKGADVKGATLYVTLEPCVHHGRTPPCVDRVIKEGIARVVIGAVDPNPRVHEKGIAALRAAGIDVDVLTSGALADDCRALIAPFTRATLDKAPYVVLKIASSLDGKVATANGASKWITGAPARALVHKLRDAVDAVVVGADTVLTDDPSLTVRDAPGRDPLRVVIDSALRTLPTARVYAAATLSATDGAPVGNARAPIVVHAADIDPERTAAFDRAGVRRVIVPLGSHEDARSERGHVDLAAALRALVPLGVMAVLLEAGPGLATAALHAGVVDEIWWFQAPFVLGADARPSIGPLGLSAPADGPRFQSVHRAIIGDDTLTIHAPTRA